MPSPFRDGPAPGAGPRTGLLLVNLGTPDAPTPAAVRRYLAEFLHDYRVVDTTRWLWCPLLHGAILPLRAPKVAKLYASVWTEQGSPLLAHSRTLAEALQAQLPEFRVALAMRYGRPALADALRTLADAGVERLLVLPLYPQYSATTTASVHDAVFAELQRWRALPELRLVNDYHMDGGWLDALEASVETHWDLHGRGEHLLLSFHGIPQRYADAGDPYPAQCRAGAHALAARLGLADDAWTLSFQSRFGREPWLQPYTDHTLAAMARRGLRTVDVICPGFAVDCLETLEEIAVQNDEAFRHAGGSALRYIPALNAEPAHVAALAGIARRHAQGLAARMSAAPQEIFLDTGRGRLAALRAGTAGGPRVLALHGWLDNAASFVPLMPFLDRLDLVALDLPGHGASAHRASGYDYAFVDWLHDVLDALDALGWERASLLGHSLGGAIATLVAAAAPARIERLALIEALGPIAGRIEDAGTRLRQAVAARRALAPTRAPRVIADLEHAVDARLAATHMSREAARLIVARNLRAVDGGVAWRSDPRLMLPSHVRSDEATVRQWIAAIDAPTLLLAADPAPPYFLPEVRTGRLAALRDGRVATLAGSHHLHMEQPAAVAAVLAPFLLS